MLEVELNTNELSTCLMRCAKEKRRGSVMNSFFPPPLLLALPLPTPALPTAILDEVGVPRELLRSLKKVREEERGDFESRDCDCLDLDLGET